MISSIGSSPTYDLNSISKPTTGLDAQIARYKMELSDCVNCESAKTAKGKTKIQAISDKLTALTAQTENAAKPQDTNQLKQWSEPRQPTIYLGLATYMILRQFLMLTLSLPVII